MDIISLLIDLHKTSLRLGPGSDETTRKAINCTGLDHTAPVKIADIGCGTGASTIVLAEELNAHITAIDFSDDFIRVLHKRAKERTVTHKIKTIVGCMEELPFDDEEYDVIWSEGAIYNMGFEKGVRDWKRYLKPDGILAVSEITWLTKNYPKELQDYWEAEYPEIDTAAAKIAVLEDAGYSLAGYFYLPETCWLENYYIPLQEKFEEFLERHSQCKDAVEIIENEKKEITLYQKYKKYYSYGFYIAQKVE